MLSMVHDIESPYKIVPDIFDFFSKVVSRHDTCCVTSYGLHLSDTTSENPYDVIEQLWAGSQEFADWLEFCWWLP